MYHKKYLIIWKECFTTGVVHETTVDGTEVAEVVEEETKGHAKTLLETDHASLEIVVIFLMEQSINSSTFSVI